MIDSSTYSLRTPDVPDGTLNRSYKKYGNRADILVISSRRTMKYSALLIASTAVAVTANPNLFLREADYDGEAADNCLQNQCQNLNNKINQVCHPIIGDVDSDTDLGNQQSISFYSCICEAMSSASSDCKSCLSSAGEYSFFIHSMI